MGTGSMIFVPAPLDKYGTRVRPRTRARISIQIIYRYLDTHGYSRIPMIFFLYKAKYFFNYLQTSTFKYPYLTYSIQIL